MLTIKQSSSPLTEPDPAFTTIDPTKVIFITDEPKKESDDNDEVQPYKMAKKIQGSIDGNADHGATNPPAPINIHQTASADQEPSPDHDNTHLDTSSKALTDEFKKGLKDTTIIEDQQFIDVTIQEKASAVTTFEVYEEPAETQLIVETPVEADNQEVKVEKIIEPQEIQQQQNDVIEQFNQLAQ